VARVVYSRLFPDGTKPKTGRLNKSPHIVHAFANRYRWLTLVVYSVFRDEKQTGRRLTRDDAPFVSLAESA
jgi:hypothetical protein